MGFFGFKKKKTEKSDFLEKSKLPGKKELPELPEFPSKLPEFPGYKKEEFSGIKREVTAPVKIDIPKRIKPLKESPIPKLPKEEKHEKFVPKKEIHLEDKPVFIKIKKYKDSVENIKLIKEKI